MLTVTSSSLIVTNAEQNLKILQGCQFGFFEAKFVIFGFLSSPLAFFSFLEKGEAFFGQLDFLCRFGRLKDGFGRFLYAVFRHRMIYIFVRNSAREFIIFCFAVSCF